MKLSIKNKLLLLIVLPFTIFIAVFLSVLSVNIEDAVLQNFEVTYSNLVSSYVQTTNEILSNSKNLVENTAELLANAKEPLTENELKQLLTEIVNEDKLIFGAVIAFAPNVFKGKKLFAPYIYKNSDSLEYIDIAETIDYTTSETDWYYLPATTKKPLWTEPYEAPVLNKRKLITYAAPILSDSVVLGVVEIDFDLETVDEYLKNSFKSKAGRFIIVDGDGTYLVHPDPEKILYKSIFNDDSSVVSLEERTSLATKMLKGSKGFLELNNITTGDKILGFYAPIEENNWSVVLYEYKSQLLAPFTNLFNTAYIALAVIFIIIVIVVTNITSRLISPIKEIKMFASKIAGGSYGQIAIKSKDEFGSLSNDLNLMSSTLKKREAELIAINKELEQRVEDRTKELKSAKENLDLALKSANMGSWKYFISEKKIVADENAKQLYGISDEEFTGSVDEWNKYIHPDDLAERHELVRQVIEKREENYVSSSRIFKPNGGLSHIMSTGKFSYDESGKPIDAFGVVWDITAIKNAEEKLKSALDEAKRLSTAVEQSPVLITITDPDVNITYVNPEYTRVTGFQPEEVIGKKHTLLRTGAISEELFSRYKKIIENGRALRGEFESKKKDGLSFWMKITGTGIADENGAIQNIVFIEDDITNQKTAEFELKEKNEFIAERNKYITDSITYAKRIQDAILPESDYVMNLLKNYFLIFRPKDIVSGDFYWINKVGNKLIIAQVDCTGHGVPGALMSMIGNTLLNEIIILQGITDSAQILNSLDRRLIEELYKAEKSKTNDGMDVGLCVIDLENYIVQYSGAYRPMFYIKEGVLNVVKGDRKSIGDQSKADKKYTSTTFEVEDSVRIYLFSDGYVDQNNSANKKIGTKRLKEILTETKNEDIATQKQKLLAELDSHQGTEDQRDDITVLGIQMTKNELSKKVIKDERTYSDSFTYENVLKIGEEIEKKYSDTIERKAYRNLYFTALELAQNIGHYSADGNVVGGKSSGIGELKISTDDDYLYVTSSNKINKSSLSNLIAKLNHYNSLDRKKLKELLKEKLRSEQDENSKGGGIGFIEIIKRTANPLYYKFEKVDEETSYITITAKINLGEMNG
jgi:PAS domain S-box-containing protein